jgi:shikimate kinase
LDRKNKLKNIILVGMTCAGKSTVGKCISELMNYELIDTDDMLDKKQGMSIDNIFRSKGEEYFRNIEKELVSDLVNCENTVISTGGGLPIYNNNMNALNDIGITVFLNANIDVIINRVSLINDRPLLKNNGRETLLKMRKDRIIFYEKADITINFCNEDTLQLSRLIIKKIQDYLNNI